TAIAMFVQTNKILSHRLLETTSLFSQYVNTQSIGINAGEKNRLSRVSNRDMVAMTMMNVLYTNAYTEAIYSKLFLSFLVITCHNTAAASNTIIRIPSISSGK